VVEEWWDETDYGIAADGGGRSCGGAGPESAGGALEEI
jgi:hypothetical protein